MQGRSPNVSSLLARQRNSPVTGPGAQWKLKQATTRQRRFRARALRETESSRRTIPFSPTFDRDLIEVASERQEVHVILLNNERQPRSFNMRQGSHRGNSGGTSGSAGKQDTSRNGEKKSSSGGRRSSGGPGGGKRGRSSSSGTRNNPAR